MPSRLSSPMDSARCKRIATSLATRKQSFPTPSRRVAVGTPLKLSAYMRLELVCQRYLDTGGSAIGRVRLASRYIPR